jgi:hypothetical protein
LCNIRLFAIIGIILPCDDDSRLFLRAVISYFDENLQQRVIQEAINFRGKPAEANKPSVAAGS